MSSYRTGRTRHRVDWKGRCILQIEYKNSGWYDARPEDITVKEAPDECTNRNEPPPGIPKEPETY